MIELIIAALVAGAVAGVSDTARQAIHDAYAGLKSAITAKFGKAKGALDALEDDPKDEDAQKLAGKRLAEANAAANADVQAAADKLAAALKAAGISVGVVAQTASGTGNVQVAGSDNTVTNNVSTGNSGITTQGSTVHGDIVQGDKVGGDKIGKQVNTAGGAYVDGNVSAGADFVGRDKIINQYGRDIAADFDASVSASGRKLAVLLTTRFSKSEVNGLCFDLGINKDELSGETLTERAEELVLLCERRNAIARLRQAMWDAREDIRSAL